MPAAAADSTATATHRTDPPTGPAGAFSFPRGAIPTTATRPDATFTPIPGAVMSSRAAVLLGCSYPALYRLIRAGLIDPPLRDYSGRYWWQEEDMAAARAALRNYKRYRPRKARTAS
jgi:hypothetical protein